MSSNFKKLDSHLTLPKSECNLIWLDMEMTGLIPNTDRILEIAMVVTNANLSVLVEGPVLSIYQSDLTLDAMNLWNKRTHGYSGLIERVRISSITEADAASLFIEFLSQYVPAGKSAMCGNSICQDRRFMACWMPELEAFFHYRNLDVSTLKELCRRWRPEIYQGLQKRVLHSALDDIYESLDELRYYRKHFLRMHA
ncbi:oligoribonuclease [Candidatus Vallotia lariciata]|uniref:oligoribonuclease n=1 Tax=Candidatus Vallotia laricis TaxID=2018052 RepID=UPI001D00C25C|nr:oligoribonuclease [Candidatus Vallotia lariciata]UDG83203.1 Oligoribonuclease [Candidatus Vallotia lariciata]